MTLIVGLGHKSRQGKDVAARAMKAGRGDERRINIYSFAHPLKLEVYHALLNFTDPFWKFIEEYTNGRVCYLSVRIPKPGMPMVREEDRLAWIESNKPALRSILQLYGGEYRRGQDKFYWVRKLGERIAADCPDIALIPDMRYLNEAYFVKANGGFTVNVVREGFVNQGAAGHTSESELDHYGYDYVLTTPEGAVDQLEREAVEVLDMILSLLTPPDFKTEDFTEEAFV